MYWILNKLIKVFVAIRFFVSWIMGLIQILPFEGAFDGVV